MPPAAPASLRTWPALHPVFSILNYLYLGIFVFLSFCIFVFSFFILYVVFLRFCIFLILCFLIFSPDLEKGQKTLFLKASLSNSESSVWDFSYLNYAASK